MTRTILVTGASSGIGQACAEHFLEKGWNVALLARRADALAAIAKDHKNALAVPADVTDESSVDAAFAKTAAHFGHLDVVFNNAGINVPSATIDEISPDDWRSVIEVNLTGSFLIARAAFRHMKTQSPQGGRIINNGSISAYTPRPGMAPYTASKHAITGLTKTISLDGRPFDIACGQIDIGNVLTTLALQLATPVTQADGSKRLEPVIELRHVAATVYYMADLPLHANVQFLTVMATNMPYIGRG